MYNVDYLQVSNKRFQEQQREFLMKEGLQVFIKDKLTNNKKGKVILVKLIANSIFSLFSTKPGAIKLTKAGIKSSTTKTKKNKPKNNKLKIWLANFIDLEFFFANSSV